MSGYNKEAGIFTLNESKMQRYLRRPVDRAIKDDSLIGYCAKLFEQHGFTVLRRTPYGIEVIADDAEVWEVLSGEAATFGAADPRPEQVYALWCKKKEWFNVTDLGKELSPSVGGAKVNKMLESIGFQQRSQDAWVPTEKARDFYKMVEGARIYRSHDKQLPMWHRKVIDVLQPLLYR